MELVCNNVAVVSRKLQDEVMDIVELTPLKGALVGMAGQTAEATTLARIIASQILLFPKKKSLAAHCLLGWLASW